MSDQVLVHPERRRLAAFALGAARTLDISASVYRDSRIKSEAEIERRVRDIRDLASRSYALDQAAFARMFNSNVLRMENFQSITITSAGSVSNRKLWRHWLARHPVSAGVLLVVLAILLYALARWLL